MTTHVGALQAQNNLSEIAAGGSVAQAAALANLGLGSVSQSSVNLKGPTSTATVDAQIGVPDGGSENLQGTLQIGAACVQILGYDGSVLSRWVSVPNATDIVGFDAGNNGAGATVYAYNGASANSQLNLVAQGLGDVNLASGAGLLANFNSPALPVTGPLIFTPETSASAASVLTANGSLALGIAGAAAPSVTGGGSFGFGQSINVSGSRSYGFGYSVNAWRNDNFVCGHGTFDNSRDNTLFWSSGHLNSFGAQQFALTQLRGQITGNGSVRLTGDQSAFGPSYSNIANLPATAGGARAGVMTLKAVVLKNTSDVATFYADNLVFINVGGTISLVTGSPSSMTAGPATAGATGISIALSADTALAGLNATVTITGGLSTDVYCCLLTVQYTENGGL